MAIDNTIARLKQLANQYRVCWEVWPESLYDDHEQHKIGFDLEIIGTHPTQAEYAVPGCELCHEVYHALRGIAAFVLPDEDRPTRYEVEPFEPKLAFSTVRHNRPDVVLEIKILHKFGLSDIDACQQRCLKDIEDRLRLIGVRRGGWDRSNASEQYRLLATTHR